MSANIESYIGRKSAWHGFGPVLGRGVTPEEAMQLGKLGDWNIRKTPLTTGIPTAVGVSEDGEIIEGTEYVEVPNNFSVTRDNPFTGQPESLGVVGNRYTIIQNESLAGMLGALVDASGGFLETAGSLNGGKSVFFSLALDGHDIQVGGVDPINMYLMLVNPHDGSGTFRGAVTGIRPVCSNTVRAGLATATSSFSFRHTGDPVRRVQDAREALQLSWKYVEVFAEEAERMVQTPIDTGTYMDIVAKMMGGVPDAKATDRTRTAFRNKMHDLGALFEVADTQSNIRGSRWAAYQSVVEWVDHFIPVKAKTAAAKSEARATNTITGANDDMKQKAFDAFRIPVAARP